MSDDQQHPKDGSTDARGRVESWLAAYGDALYAFALQRLGQSQDAEDAVQEALLAAMRSAEHFRGDSTERTWLTGILLHKVQDLLRKRARESAWKERVADELAAESPMFRGGFFRERPIDWDRGLPEHALQSAELRSFLLKEIERLPPAMRAAFCLRELDDVSTEEVCQVLGVTATNLWTLVHRAKVRLREAVTRKWLDR